MESSRPRVCSPESVTTADSVAQMLLRQHKARREGKRRKPRKTRHGKARAAPESNSESWADRSLLRRVRAKSRRRIRPRPAYSVERFFDATHDCARMKHSATATRATSTHDAMATSTHASPRMPLIASIEAHRSKRAEPPWLRLVLPCTPRFTHAAPQLADSRLFLARRSRSSPCRVCCPPRAPRLSHLLPRSDFRTVSTPPCEPAPREN